jgi:hypothetical protein
VDENRHTAPAGRVTFSQIRSYHLRGIMTKNPQYGRQARFENIGRTTTVWGVCKYATNPQLSLLTIALHFTQAGKTAKNRKKAILTTFKKS